jgi:hypothetical protein
MLGSYKLFYFRPKRYLQLPDTPEKSGSFGDIYGVTFLRDEQNNIGLR